MAFFDRMDSAATMLEDWWTTRWNKVGETFSTSWKTAFWEKGLKQFGAGIAGMASALFDDEGDFLAAGRQFLDGLVNTGSGLLGGTLGALGEFPVVHEPLWVLDKAYRYGVQRPFATGLLMGANAEDRDGDGRDFGDAFEAALDPQVWRKSWNDSAKSTPGQLMTWTIGGAATMATGGDELTWMEAHDPRTAAGRAAFAGEDSEFLLKYGSGTIDLVSAVLGDPSHGAGQLAKLAKLKYIDHTASPTYVGKGKVHDEIGTTTYEKVRTAALQAATKEEFRDRTMPAARFGGQVADVLFDAARLDLDAPGRTVFDDAYLVARAGDQAAWGRLRDAAPDIASDLARLNPEALGKSSRAGAKWSNGDPGAPALIKSDVDALVEQMATGKGSWGGLATGPLLGEAQPAVRAATKLRIGAHNWALRTAPIQVAKPWSNGLARFNNAVTRPTARRLMPSQGWTPLLDSADTTGIALRQLKANLERGELGRVLSEEEAAAGVSLTPALISERGAARINHYVSAYAAATTDAARKRIADTAHREAIRGLALKHGVDDRTMKRAIDYYNRFQLKPVASWGKAVYISERAAERAEKLIAAGRVAEAGQALRWAEDYRDLFYPGGEPGYLATLDQDGGTVLQQLPGRERKNTEADPGEPVLTSQLADMILSPDLKGLDAALKFWGNMHPKSEPYPVNAYKGAPQVVNGSPYAQGKKIGNWPYQPQMVSKWDQLYGKVVGTSKIAGYTAVSSLDFANMLWKSSALFRLAQVPRNLADDTARRMLEFGKGHLFMSAFDGAVNSMRNLGVRWNSVRAAKISAGERYSNLTVGAHGHAAGNSRSVSNPSSLNDYDSINEAFIDGALSQNDLQRITHDLAVRGALPGEEAALWQGHKNGLLDAGRYRRLLARQVLARAGRTKYMDRDFLLSVMDQLQAQNVTSRKAGAGAGEVFVDPFTGITPPLGSAHFDRVRSETIRTFDPEYEAGWREAGLFRIADFVERNVDELLMPDRMLALHVRPNGNVAISVARAKPEVAAGQPVKLSAPERWKDLPFGSLRAAGHEGFNIVTPNNPAGYKMAAAYDGPVGNKLQHRASSRGSGGSWQFIIGDVLHEGTSRQGWGPPIQARDAKYAPAWERSVNAQLASDRVARMFIAGKTEAQVLAEIETKPWGATYLERIHFRGVNYVDHVRQVEAMVAELVPDTGTTQAAALRQAVLDKRARREDLDAVVAQVDQPDVHGESVQNLLADLKDHTGRTAAHLVARGIDKIQKYLSDIPVDMASRHPFMAEAYRRHLDTLVRVFDREFGKSGNVIPAGMIARLQDVARERALYDMKYTLYDVAQQNDLARLTRLIVPFSSAYMDAFMKYGRRFRGNPAQALQAVYYWQTFERNEMVQDEHGHVLRLEGGEERWYSIDQETGEESRVDGDLVGQNRYVQFQLPGNLPNWLGGNPFGTEHRPVVAVNKESFNVFLDLVPAAGPLVAVPANEFALANPEFGEAKLISQVVLPFGPSTDRTKALLPGNVRSAWDAYYQDEGDKAEGYARAIYQSELIGYGMGLRDDKPTYAEARERAGGMFTLRALATWITPVSFQLKSPYQPYIDAYRQLIAKDPGTADMEFYRRYGDEFHGAMLSVTRNNLGMSASAASAKNFKKNYDLLERYPQLGGLITGSELGEFSKAYYESQKALVMPGGEQRAAEFGSTTPQMVRETMTPQEAAEDLEQKRGWQGYAQMMDLITAVMVERGVTSLRDGRARDLLATKNAYIEKNSSWFNPVTGREVESPWHVQFQTSGSPEEMQARLDDMREIASDKDIRKRDDMQGLLEYLSLRDTIQEVMANRGVATLDSRRAFDLRERWEAEVFNLVERNLPFAAVWSRYLSNDNSLNLLSGGAGGTTLPDTPEAKKKLVQDAIDFQNRTWHDQWGVEHYA